MPESRGCHGTTKKGVACKAPPLRDSDYCIGHTSKETKVSLGFGGPQEGSGRPKKARTVDLMREWVEDHPEAFEVIQDALKAERAIVVGNTKDAYVEYVPDWPTRIIAFKELMDRSYGRAKSSTELTIIPDDLIMREIERLEAQLAEND